MEEAAASVGVRIAVATRLARPASEPKITAGFRGATKRARPVASVVTRSPLEKFTTTPGVSRPFTSSTASVARWPETILRGRRRVLAEEGAGGDCGAADGGTKKLAIAQAKNKNRRCRAMRGIVVENLLRAKARARQEPSFIIVRVVSFLPEGGLFRRNFPTRSGFGILISVMEKE